mmetsp:Transcript_39040/g.90865  ORF Transcript_39040/g.90865 Transcript_39040/m.90865 type:complete len:80 (-) Transcript_39040:1124-1363(-)
MVMTRRSPLRQNTSHSNQVTLTVRGIEDVSGDDSGTEDDGGGVDIHSGSHYNCMCNQQYYYYLLYCSESYDCFTVAAEQ